MRATVGGLFITYLILLATGLAVAGLGYLSFIAFVEGVLKPHEFASYGLAFTAVAGGVASFFSPCSFTVLPTMVILGDMRDANAVAPRVRRALARGLLAALGVLSSAVVIGVIIGALGTGLGPTFSIFSSSPNSAIAKAIRISIGAVLVAMGLVHLLDLSHRLPLAGRVAAWAGEFGLSQQASARSAYVYGAVYIGVGFG